MAGSHLAVPVALEVEREPWGKIQRFHFGDGFQLERATAYYRLPFETCTAKGGEVMHFADPERAARLRALGQIAAKEPEQARFLAEFLNESPIPLQHLL